MLRKRKKWITMNETREQVYNVPYEIYHAPKKGGFTSLLYRFRRFTLDRQRVTFDMLSPGQRFLDVGCGFGLLVTMAKDKFDEVYGIDISSSNIERAGRSIEDRSDKEKIFFSQLDVEKGLPFDDSFFDAVSTVAVLEHIFNPPSLLDEISRVLKSKGQFIVEVPNFAWLPRRLQLLFGELPVTGGTDKLGIDWLHLHNFTESTLTYSSKAKGLKLQVCRLPGHLQNIVDGGFHRSAQT